MKLIVNESFQFKGVHRQGVTLTVSEDMLRSEIKKGRHHIAIRGRLRWLSGLMEHCTPANHETADFIESLTKVKVVPDKVKVNEVDDSDEIRAIRAEFDTMGKAYDKRWQIKRLRNEIVKARLASGEEKADKPQVETSIED